MHFLHFYFFKTKSKLFSFFSKIGLKFFTFYCFEKKIEPFFIFFYQHFDIFASMI